MAMWVVRAGKYGEREDAVVQEGIAAVGWDQIGDLKQFPTQEQIKHHLEEQHPEAPPGRTAGWAGQLWAFSRRIQTGDWIVLPLKKQSALALGRVTGGYDFVANAGPELHHRLAVKWQEERLPRSKFSRDMLFALDVPKTIFQVASNAENLILGVFRGVPVPHPPEGPEPPDLPPTPNPESVARDQIVQRIEQEFKGHPLAQLVGAILETQGYRVSVSPPGPDKGVDVLAGSGPMGLDSPKICVQVKSGGVADVTVYRNLKGILSSFGAEQGLLVSWDGFNDPVRKEARVDHFRIRLWDQGTLVDALLQNYDRLPDQIRAQIPLKHIWTLIEPTEE